MKKADNFKLLLKRQIECSPLIMIPEFGLKQYIKVIAVSNLLANIGPLNEECGIRKKIENLRKFFPERY